MAKHAWQLTQRFNSFDELPSAPDLTRFKAHMKGTIARALANEDRYGKAIVSMKAACYLNPSAKEMKVSLEEYKAF